MIEGGGGEKKKQSSVPQSSDPRFSVQPHPPSSCYTPGMTKDTLSQDRWQIIPTFITAVDEAGIQIT